MRIAALAGGVGGAKFLLGLTQAMDPKDITVIANTGDDIVVHGLMVSPDPDIITYTLGGVVNPETGWGFAGESFTVLNRLKTYGHQTWFQLGDRDLATHIHRTAMLAAGARLSEVADSIRTGLGVEAKILPMSDQPVRTMLDTDQGWLHLQEYLVQRRAEPVIRAIRFDGLESALPAPGVMEALDHADAIILCPSNPLISIGPILAVPGIRERLRERRDDVVAISPLVGGKALKGATDKMMRELGLEATTRGIARLYRDVAGTLVIDSADEADAPHVIRENMKAVIRPTIMTNMADKERLARDVLALIVT